MSVKREPGDCDETDDEPESDDKELNPEVTLNKTPLIKWEIHNHEIPKDALNLDQNVKLKKTPTSMSVKKEPGDCDETDDEPEFENKELNPDVKLNKTSTSKSLKREPDDYVDEPENQKLMIWN